MVVWDSDGCPNSAFLPKACAHDLELPDFFLIGNGEAFTHIAVAVFFDQRAGEPDGLAELGGWFCLEKGSEPEHGAKNALQSTEIIFACWESVRRRGICLEVSLYSNWATGAVASIEKELKESGIGIAQTSIACKYVPDANETLRTPT
jgi:hypothetical protein